MLNNLIINFNKTVIILKQQGIWVFFGRVYLLIISFTLSIILTNYLSIEEYGQYKYYLSVFSMAAIFTLPESSQIMRKYLVRNGDSLYLFTTKIKLQFSLIGSLFLILYFFYLYNIENIHHFEYLIFAVLIPFYYSFDLYTPFLQAKNDFKTLNKLFIIKSTNQMLFVLLSLFFYKSAVFATLAYILSVIMSNLFFYRFIINKYNIIIANNRRKNKIFKSQMIILSGIGLLPIFSENIDKIFIGKVIDYESLAVFSIGILIGKTLNGFFKPFLTILYSKLVFKKLSNNQYFFLLLTGTIIGVIIISFISIFINFTYGIKYTESSIYAKIIVSSMGLYFVQTIYYNENLLHKKASMKYIYVNNIITPLILIISMLFIIYSNNSVKIKLILLTLLYPIKLTLTIINIFILKLLNKS